MEVLHIMGDFLYHVVMLPIHYISQITKRVKQMYRLQTADYIRLFY